jgi:hypothetical protein
MGKIREFIQHHYRHFNARALIDAAGAYERHLEQGGQMLVTLAGAMSTAELGLSLAEMIREGKVHAISCTGANLEEDIFNLVAHDYYLRLPHYRELSAEDGEKLRVRHLYRVTDTCIPEEEPSAAWKGPCSKNGLPPTVRAKPISRTNSSTGSCLPASSSNTIRSTQRRAGCSGRSEGPGGLGSRLGGLHAWQHLRELRHQRRHQECLYGSHRH